MCFAAQYPGTANCRYCGEPFPLKPEYEQVLDNLAELLAADRIGLRDAVNKAFEFGYAVGQLDAARDIEAVIQRRGYAH